MRIELHLPQHEEREDYLAALERAALDTDRYGWRIVPNPMSEAIRAQRAAARRERAA